MKPRWPVLLLVLASVGAVLLAAALPETILAGDVVPYRLRMKELFSGRIPYLDFGFEHLPVMIIPMAMAWMLGGWIDLSAYAFAFAGVSIALLLMTLWPLQKLEKAHGMPGLTRRWVVLTVPLLPLLLFRNDSLVVLLGLLGIWWAVSGRHQLSLVVLSAGILSKLWPVLWFVPEWWRRRRGQALVLLAVAGLGVSIALSPSAQSIQDPQGLHTGTVSGSVLGLVRAVSGQELDIKVSATAYIGAPGWLTMVNVTVGVGLALLALKNVRQGYDARRAFVLTGGLVGAGLVGGPFLSAQYLAWLGPFVASNPGLSWFMTAVNVVNVALIATWFELFDGAVWWWALMVARNLSLIVIVALLALSEESRSLATGRSTKGHLP